jgi:hypothetical protein
MTQIHVGKYEASKTSLGDLEDIYVQTQFFNSDMIAKWRFGWLEEAKCLDEQVPVEEFYKTEYYLNDCEDDAMRRKKYIKKDVANVCASCPVASECVSYSIWEENILGRLDLGINNFSKTTILRFGYKHSFPQERETLSNLLTNHRVSMIDYPKYVKSWIVLKRKIGMNVCILDQVKDMVVKNNKILFRKDSL